MTTTVSFEIAKLLKEKGFDENCRFGYNGLFEPHHTGLIEFFYLQRNSELLELTYSAPTIAEVVMWLYEKHGIWIQTPFSHNDVKPFCWVVNKTLRNISEDDENRNCWLSGIDCDNVDGYNSPTEGYSSAIEYTLNNLI